MLHQYWALAGAAVPASGLSDGAAECWLELSGSRIGLHIGTALQLLHARSAAACDSAVHSWAVPSAAPLDRALAGRWTGDDGASNLHMQGLLSEVSSVLSKTPFLQKLGGTSSSSKERSCGPATPSHPSLLAKDHPGSEPSCLDSDPSTAGCSI